MSKFLLPACALVVATFAMALARPALAQAITETAPSLGQGAPAAGVPSVTVPAPAVPVVPEATAPAGGVQLGTGTTGDVRPAIPSGPAEPYAPGLGTGSGLLRPQATPLPGQIR